VKPPKLGIFLALAGAFGCLPLAHADLGGKGAVQPVRPPSDSPPPAIVPDGSASLRQGVVTAVAAAGDRVEIHGRWHRIDQNRTRFVRDGRVARSDSLQKGQTLMFTLLAEQGENTTLGLVYVP
jgi:hypothetical protein